MNSILSKFQFHKVQLKGNIPQANERFSGFQFHKVQLKDGTIQIYRITGGFQFHKVQLKEKIYSDHFRNTQVSIP